MKNGWETELLGEVCEFQRGLTYAKGDEVDVSDNIVLRALAYARREEDAFTRLAVAGLALLFGFQSAIAMAVSLYLIPAKGMTLPFVSYGGSSLISLAFGVGMLIALTRKRSRAESLAELEHATDRNNARRGAAA